MSIEHLAEQIHESARSVYAAFNMDAQQKWSELDDADKESAISIVKAALETKVISAKSWHDIWSGIMRDKGWVIGPLVDYSTKQHPALVDYEKLSTSSPVERVRLQVQAGMLRVAKEQAAAKMQANQKK